MSRIVIVALVMGSFGFGLTTYAWGQRRDIPMVTTPPATMIPNQVMPGQVLTPPQPPPSQPSSPPLSEQRLRDDLREEEIRAHSLQERLPPGNAANADLNRSLSEAQRRLDDYHLNAREQDAQGVNDAMRDVVRKREAAERAAAGQQ
ncbi:MAG TPA: hypothetical protein VK558_02275 [Patescibacteria group bacterium]|nr:hypothetical protein [Patescibacteria group bacterium]